MDITQQGHAAEPAPASAACAAILRGTLKPSLVVCALTTLVFLVAKGTGAALASLLAAALTVGCIAVGLFVMSRFVSVDPLAFLGGAIVIYFGQTIVLGLAMFRLSEAGWLDAVTFGVSALVAVVAWQIFLVRAFMRARRPVYDTPGFEASGLDVPQ